MGGKRKLDHDRQITQQGAAALDDKSLEKAAGGAVDGYVYFQTYGGESSDPLTAVGGPNNRLNKPVDSAIKP